MYHLLRRRRPAEILGREAPPALASLVIAEVFYKFHSFTLECVAFLATWFALSWVLGRLFARGDRAAESAPSTGRDR